MKSHNLTSHSHAAETDSHLFALPAYCLLPATKSINIENNNSHADQAGTDP